MIYFLKFTQTGYIKIGTTSSFYDRAIGLKSEHGEFEVLGFMAGSFQQERELHRRFEANRASYHREFFHQSDDLMEYIRLNASTCYREGIRKTRQVRVGDVTSDVINEIVRSSPVKLTHADVVDAVLRASHPNYDAVIANMKKAQGIIQQYMDDAINGKRGESS